MPKSLELGGVTDAEERRPPHNASLTRSAAWLELDRDPEQPSSLRVDIDDTGAVLINGDAPPRGAKASLHFGRYHLGVGRRLCGNRNRVEEPYRRPFHATKCFPVSRSDRPPQHFDYTAVPQIDTHGMDAMPDELDRVSPPPIDDVDVRIDHPATRHLPLGDSDRVVQAYIGIVESRHLICCLCPSTHSSDVKSKGNDDDRKKTQIHRAASVCARQQTQAAGARFHFAQV
jgi:hypothetical protein